MIGFCQICGTNKEMESLETSQLPSMDFVHKGNCSSCGGSMMRSVKDNELLVLRNGRRCPEVVFVGKSTLKRLYKHKIGQKIYVEGTFTKTEKAKGVKTLKEIKKEVRKNEKINT